MGSEMCIRDSIGIAGAAVHIGPTGFAGFAGPTGSAGLAGSAGSAGLAEFAGPAASPAPGSTSTTGSLPVT